MRFPDTNKSFEGKRAVVVDFGNDAIHECTTDQDEHQLLTSMLAKYSEATSVDTFDMEKAVVAVPFYDATNLFYLLNEEIARTTEYQEWVTGAGKYDRMHPQGEDLIVITLDGKPTLYVHYVHGDCGTTAFYLTDK